MKTNNEITFKNNNQKVLYITELSGQISDGMWENSRPHNHWQPMCDAQIKVGNPNINFSPLRKYHFETSELLCVRNRMKFWVKLSMAYPEFLKDENLEDHWTYDLSDGADIKIPANEPTDGYWHTKMNKQMKFFKVENYTDLQNVIEKINSQPYTDKQLIADLKEMSKIVNGDHI
jgi:hypothetical protein